MTEQRHRAFRAIALATLGVGLLPVAFAASVAEPGQLAGTFLGWGVAAYLLAAAGTLAAAVTFSPGDPLRAGWFFLSASYLALVPGMVRIGPKASGLFEQAVRAPWVIFGGSIVSGVLGVAAFVLLTRAWRASGLDVGSAAARTAARVAALLVAAALAGPDLVQRTPDALRGDVLAAGDVITDLLDGALFVVAVPVLRAALALGGGLAAWPWMLLTASLAAWLGYDAVAIYGGAVGVGPRSVRVAEEIFRTLGALFACTAGVTQRVLMVAARVPGGLPPAAGGGGTPAA